MVRSKRKCELCNADIAKEWDNEQHYGTCPSCKRGANFIIENEELQEVAEAENERCKLNRMLTQYGVITINERSGVRKINCVNLGKMIFGECGYYFKTIEDIDTGKQEIYYYRGGYYHRGGENRIRELVDKYLDDLSSIHRKNEVADYIRHINIVDRHKLEPPVHLVNLANGIYDIDKDKLCEHNPEHFFLNQIPINYVKGAKCPMVEKFFKDVVYEAYVPVIQEMFGYCLYRKYKYHKAFLLYGGGRNGKSTTVDLLKVFIGEGNYSAETLDDLLDNRFSKANLYGKLVNIGAEIGGGAINDTSQFKHLTGNDTIRAERKFYGSFTFNNYAKLIFNANYIPYSKYDKSTAFFNRWIILVFPETFDQDDDRTDPDIADKLTTKKELEGLLLWGIEGLRRLIKNERFSYDDDKDEEEVGERYELLAKPEKRFITNFLMLSPEGTIPTTEVFEIYEEWASKRRYPVLAKSSFSRSMKRYLREVDMNGKPVKNGVCCEIVNTTMGGKSMRMYKNIMWKDMPSNSLEVKKLDNYVDDVALVDKIKELRKSVKKNKKAGYCIDDEWLNCNFEGGFVYKCIESGILRRLPDGSYEVE